MMLVKKHLKRHGGSHTPPSNNMHLAEAPGPGSSNNAPESSTGDLPYHKKMFDYHSAESKRIASQPDQSADYTTVAKAHQTLAVHHAQAIAKQHKSEPVKKLKRD